MDLFDEKKSHIFENGEIIRQMDFNEEIAFRQLLVLIITCSMKNVSS